MNIVRNLPVVFPYAVDEYPIDTKTAKLDGEDRIK